MDGRGALIVRVGWALLAAALLGLLFTALYLAADAEGFGRGFADYYPHVFLLATLALLALTAAIVQRIRGLRRRLREQAPGARLNRRLLAWLLVLALPPVMLVYGFGVRFIGATVDSWMRANSAEILQRAANIGRLYLDEREARARQAVQLLMPRFETSAESGWNALAEQALLEFSALQVSVFDASGRNRALAAASSRWVRAEPPAEDMGSLAAEGAVAVRLEPEGEGLVLTATAGWRAPLGAMRVQLILPMPDAVAADLVGVEQGIADARQASFLRDSLKWAFILILSIVLVLSVLLALLLAFDLSKRLVAPVGRLAAATRQVAEGRYDVRLPEDLDDELGFLVRGFNRMLRELESSAARARDSQAETERQRAFLETILGRLSSCVLVLDVDGRIRVVNPACANLLGGQDQQWLGLDLPELIRARPEQAALWEAVLARWRDEGREFREEVAVGAEAARRLWLLRGARLADGGLVAVFDDTTEIDRARRDAAWAEVARRLAHEIKNPLTPIQLAAERLRRKLLPGMQGDEAQVLDRATHTIINQVDALKTLVNAFGDYARAPQMQIRSVDLAALVHEVAELYAGEPRLRVRTDVAERLPPLQADSGRLRQVLHNLIKNALEAAPGQVVHVQISATPREISGRRMLELSVADDGPGLPEGFNAEWFEPYRTTKAKGTGLGLAVVRKIAEEHAGQVAAENRPEGGAVFRLLLPA